MTKMSYALGENEIWTDGKILECKFCNNTKFEKEGYKGWDLRFKCLKCEGRYIPDESTKYAAFKTSWITRKEWEGER